MDLIRQLIAVKSNDYSETLKDLISEIILYEKLSKSPKFQHIQESVLLQKKLPNIWKAFQGDPYYGGQFGVAIHMMMHLMNDTPLIYTDYQQSRTKKEMQQADIFGKLGRKFNYSPLSQYNPMQPIEFGISHTTGDDIAMSIVVKPSEHEQNYVIYQGTIPNITDDESDNLSTYVIPKYVHVADSCEIKITTYSLQGNNNYPFGELQTDGQTWIVSMPNQRTFRYTQGENVLEYEMTSGELTAFNLHKMKIESFAQSCIDYFIKGGQDGNF